MSNFQPKNSKDDSTSCSLNEKTMAEINQECLEYGKKHFKDLERTSYRVPDVLFPREGQTGDVLTEEEIRSGLHEKVADKRHKNVSIKKLLEERRALAAVEAIVKRLYNWGTTHREAMFILCNYKFQQYFGEIPSKMSLTIGDHDIVAMGLFGFVFIQVKACGLPTTLENVRENDSDKGEMGQREPSGGQLGSWRTNHIQKAVEQLFKDRQELMERNDDLSFVSFSPMHLIVGIPDMESVHDKAVREAIETKIDSYEGSRKKGEKRMRVFIIYKDTVASQKNFDDWFRRCVLLMCETKRLFFSDDLYTIVGRYTCPKYSKVSRLSIPGLGTKRSSALLSRYVYTKDQDKLLRSNARRQIVAGGFGTGKTLLLLEEAINLVIGPRTNFKDNKQQNKGRGKRKAETQATSTWTVFTGNSNGSFSEVDNTQTQCENRSSEDPRKVHIKPSFSFILSCSNVGENGFVFNDPDQLVEQMAIHLKMRVKGREEEAKNKIEIYKLDEVIQKSFPEERCSQSNIACEMLTVDVLIKVIHDLAESKPGYTCHVMLDEFPSLHLVNGFDWSKLQKLHHKYPDMRLWIALSAEGNMQTYLSCDDTLEIQKALSVPREFEFGFLQESKRMTKNVYKLMEKTQEYEGKTKREHFRCGIEIEDHIPMWIPMSPCSCGRIENGFLECTCMCGRLIASLREVFHRISHFGNEHVFILLHVVMFESLRENLVDLWTKALREIKVGCRVHIPRLEHYSFKVEVDESNDNHSQNDREQVTLIHNRYFHGCEGKVMIVFPPLGGPQFQPHQEGSSLALPFDSVVARSVSRLFIITPTEVGMIQYSKELCKYITKERELETDPVKNAKWDKFLSIFGHRKYLPSYLMKMEKEGVLVKCPVSGVMVGDKSLPMVDTMHTLNITEAPITKWYMTPSQSNSAH